MAEPAIDEEKLDRVAFKIAREIQDWTLEIAEEIAERICSYRESQIPRTDREGLRSSLAEIIYYSAERKITPILKKNSLTGYGEDVKAVCIEELKEALYPLMLEFSGTESPGLVEMALEDGATKFNLRLEVSLRDLFQDELDRQAKSRKAAVRSAAAERIRRRQSRGLLEIIADWFKR